MQTFKNALKDKLIASYELKNVSHLHGNVHLIIAIECRKYHVSNKPSKYFPTCYVSHSYISMAGEICALVHNVTRNKTNSRVI